MAPAVPQVDQASGVLLLVGAGAMAEGYLSAAQRRGWSVAVVESVGRLEELRSRFSCVVDGEPIESTSTVDESWILPTVMLAERTRPSSVLAFAESHVLAATFVQEKLGLRGPGMCAAAASRNKAAQRSLFATAGLGQPEWKLVSELGDAANWAHERLPVVVKPLSRMGSSGVERVDDVTAWEETVQRRAGDGPLLVEEYIPGDEYSLEAFVSSGEILFCNLTKKMTSGAPNFVELAHIVGYANEDPELSALAKETLAGVVNAVGVKTSIVHLEFRLRENGTLAVMEVAVRTPGDHILELASMAYDFDLYEVAIDLAFGNRPSRELLAVERARIAGVQYVVSSSQGTLRDIDCSEWAQLPGVERSYIMAEIGEEVRPATESAERLGYVLFAQSDLTTLRLSMDKAVEASKFLVI
ncbi:ATP-grasp domain-containing protein [Rathayibacter toxicus]|uniref:ATP-grasp domain-containing protein n=1 Tax=Rathayibacter toxicus TaxID=145458 RepID=UPI000CE75FC8|nr:ATP-grasp domain-containing protein [Rathayibacter toxicus]PPI55350.1 DabC [Rathayibacter toxicus]QOD11318.1 ATP-grasp domain-containing protein [Rathayibacter toxicus]QWL28060.1 ATP-grasp domain-containing protein [Rathayibacter toxicus]QWL32259.1 ATP-grasp domain-containing protein [Rathayibacter toxicus]QWL34352.1 ATP-grasp domain-containing protein [Rathayibacter toxicus]